MSLDTLFHQILLTEQQVSENARQLHEVKAAISRGQEKVKSLTEELGNCKKELEEKAQLQAEMKLQMDLAKKRLEETKKQKENLLQQQSDLNQRLNQMKKESFEEHESFMTEMTTFNSDYNLLNAREAVFHSQTRAETESLEREIDSLKKEMEVISQRNSRVSSMQSEKKSLLLELHTLESHYTELEVEVNDARVFTEALTSERQMASQKPLTDSTCLRLRKELEMYKEGELELLQEALSSEIHFLRSKLSQQHVEDTDYNI